MHTEVIHRLVEQQAVSRGDAVAIRCGTDAMTYRALNARANVAARQLISSGLRRGGHALVSLDGPALAVVALAVLKAGASYTRVSHVSDRHVPGVAIHVEHATTPEQYLRVALHHGDATAQTSANLPVLTRGSDIACLMNPFSQTPTGIAHAHIVARRAKPELPAAEMIEDAVLLPLWLTLMAGATLTLPVPVSAAA